MSHCLLKLKLPSAVRSISLTNVMIFLPLIKAINPSIWIYLFGNTFKNFPQISTKFKSFSFMILFIFLLSVWRGWRVHMCVDVFTYACMCEGQRSASGICLYYFWYLFILFLVHSSIASGISISCLWHCFYCSWFLPPLLSILLLLRSLTEPGLPLWLSSLGARPPGSALPAHVV